MSSKNGKGRNTGHLARVANHISEIQSGLQDGSSPEAILQRCNAFMAAVYDCNKSLICQGIDFLLIEEEIWVTLIAAIAKSIIGDKEEAVRNAMKCCKLAVANGNPEILDHASRIVSDPSRYLGKQFSEIPIQPIPESPYKEKGS